MKNVTIKSGDQVIKCVDNLGKESAVFKPAQVYHLLGTKKSGAKVAVKLDRQGLAEQMGVNKDGTAIFSSKPFNGKKWFLNHIDRDWSKYLCDLLNLESIEMSDAKLLREYRVACELSMTGEMRKVYNDAVATADGSADDVKAGFIEAAIQARANANISLKMAKDLGKVTKAKPVVVELTSDQKKAALAAKGNLDAAKKELTSAKSKVIKMTNHAIEMELAPDCEPVQKAKAAQDVIQAKVDLLTLVYESAKVGEVYKAPVAEVAAK